MAKKNIGFENWVTTKIGPVCIDWEIRSTAGCMERQDFWSGLLSLFLLLFCTHLWICCAKKNDFKHYAQ